MEIKYLYILFFFYFTNPWTDTVPTVWAASSSGVSKRGEEDEENQYPQPWNQSALICVFTAQKIYNIGREREREGSVGYDCYYFYVQKRPQGGLLFCCFSGIFLLTGKLEGRCLNCHALIDSFLIIFLALQHLRLRNVYPFFSFPTLRRVTVNIRTFSRFDAETKSFSIKIKIIF